jgi:2-hydroxy-3-oxopropionate reductase
MRNTPADVAREADIVITMLPDTPDVESVIAGPDGVLEGLRAGAVVIDMSSISPAATRELAARVAAREAKMLDAPVSGGEIGAKNATLSIMVGGDANRIRAGQANPRLHGQSRTDRAHRHRSGVGADLQDLQSDRDRRGVGRRERSARARA